MTEKNYRFGAFQTEVCLSSRLTDKPSLPWWPQYLTSPPLLPHFGFIAGSLGSSLLVALSGNMQAVAVRGMNLFKMQETKKNCISAIAQNVNCTRTLPPNFNLHIISNLHFTAPASMTFLMHEHNFEWKFMQK